jgi:hypothetical protein
MRTLNWQVRRVERRRSFPVIRALKFFEQRLSAASTETPAFWRISVPDRRSILGVGDSATAESTDAGAFKNIAAPVFIATPESALM